ncbi:MAG: sensor domain-containing diguanylate cyclase [Bacillota bacterium]
MIINNDFRIFSPQDLTVRKEYRKVYEDASGRYCPLSKGMNSFEGNEEIFRQLIVNINDAFWVMDLVVSRFIYISPAYREIWGRPCQFLYDNPESFKSSIHPKDWSKIKTAMERLCITGEKSEEEYRIIRPDGSVRWIWGRMFPVVDSQNRVYRLVGVAEDITRRKQLEQELIKLATLDPLTGSNNRYSFLEKAQGELTRALRYEKPFTFLMLDIDDFKQINDNFGHHMGDEVLKRMVRKSMATLRKNDIFGRLGGEEFGVVLIETDPLKGLVIAERLRTNLAKLKIKNGKKAIGFTVSIGLAVLRESDRSIEQIMRRADKALYEAKNKGRNRVVRGC